MSQIRILADDGGGILGLIPAMVRTELERRLGGPLAPHFNMQAGTSAGAMNVTTSVRLQGKPLLTAAELKKIYIDKGHAIFQTSFLRDQETGHSLWAPRYNVTSLQQVVRGIADSHWLSEVDDDMIALAHDIASHQNHYFESWAARDGRVNSPPQKWDYTLFDVMLGSAAAPTYFPAHPCVSRNGEPHLVIDGGMTGENNPARKALSKAVQLYGTTHEYLVVSLGTGSSDHLFGRAEKFNGGFLQWAPHLLPTIFAASARSVDDDMEAALGDKYVSIQTSFLRQDTNSPAPRDNLAAASEQNIDLIQEWGEQTVRDYDRQIDKLCDIIVKNPAKSKQELLAEAGRPMPPGPPPPKF